MFNGLALCTRFSYPPNSFSLCGPSKQIDLSYYSNTQKCDKGTKEILTQFSTLYPYLILIASNNGIKDIFDQRVVEAYWLGNRLLPRIDIKDFSSLLTDKLQLLKKIKKDDFKKIQSKLDFGGVPHHSFHVLNIYKRTGHTESIHTIQTMDACIINWGKIISIKKKSVEVSTRPLSQNEKGLILGKLRTREISFQGMNDSLRGKICRGDYISYHWGYICHKLTKLQLLNLMYYTKLAINLANLNL